MNKLALLANFPSNYRRFLSLDYPKISIISSALLATISIFYVFVAGSYTQIIAYFFLKRFTYIKPFNEHLVSQYYDSVIIGCLATVWLVISLSGKFAKIFSSSVFGILLGTAIVADSHELLTFVKLATFPVILFFLLLSKYKMDRKKKSHRYKRKTKSADKEIVQSFRLDLTINYLAMIIIALGVYSILISLSVITGLKDIPVDRILESKVIPLDNYGYELFIFFSAFSPLLLIVTFFSPVKLLVSKIFQKIPKLNEKLWVFRSDELTHFKLQFRKKTIYLLAFILFSISLAIIPQLLTINKDNQQVGSDSDSYIEWIGPLDKAKSLQEFLKMAFVDLMRGDRPLTLILLYSLTIILDAPALEIFENLPLVLAPALVLVVYFLTRELTSNETTAILAAFLTGVGNFQISMGIYAGLYANWIALLVGYLSVIFLFRFSRRPSKKQLSIFFLLLVAVLFSHAYTWTVITVVIGVFLGIAFIFRLYPRRNTAILLLAVVLTVVIDVVKTRIVESVGSAGGIKLVMTLAETNISLKEFGLVWEALVSATQLHYGGILCNVVVLALVIYWIIRSNFRADYNLFVMVFLAVGIPPLFLGDWIVQSRVFYNIPFQIPAAIALTYIAQKTSALRILLPIYVWLIAISIWTVSNFYKVNP